MREWDFLDRSKLLLLRVSHGGRKKAALGFALALALNYYYALGVCVRVKLSCWRVGKLGESRHVNKPGVDFICNICYTRWHLLNCWRAHSCWEGKEKGSSPPASMVVDWHLMCINSLSRNLDRVYFMKVYGFPIIGYLFFSQEAKL